MKKLLASLLVVFALPLIGRADSVTSRLSLTEPDVNSANWGTKLNNNFGLIDAGVGVLGKSNVWTQTNTFQGPVIISSYTTITSSVAFSTITATLLTATNETVNTLTVLSSATVGTIQGPVTVISSVTFTGDVGIAGNVTKPLTLTSSQTIRSNAEVDGVFSATGTVTLGSAGQAITMKAPVTATSSMTVTSNAEVDGVFKATSSVILGNGSGNSVTVNSSETVNGNFSVTGQINAPVTLTSSVTSNSTIYGVGSIVQVVLSSVTASSATTTTTFANMGLNGTITPKSTTSLILIHAMASYSGSGLGQDNKWTIYRGNTNICQGNGCTTQNEYVANNVMSATILIWDNPATTSAVTYQVRAAANSGTVTLNSDANVSTLFLEELGQ